MQTDTDIADHDAILRLVATLCATRLVGLPRTPGWRPLDRGCRAFPVNRHAKLTPYRRPKLTPLATSRSGPDTCSSRTILFTDQP